MKSSGPRWFWNASALVVLPCLIACTPEVVESELPGNGTAEIGNATQPQLSLEPKAVDVPSVETQNGESEKTAGNEVEVIVASEPTTKLATFGGGCFWCVESVFDHLEGVVMAESGYEGGTLVDPWYDAVCSGSTGHAEAVRVHYDPQKISFPELLEVFWKTHDPTTLNSQGNDFGTQYRSAIFYHDDEQKELAKAYMKKIDESGAFNGPLVTEISPTTKFYVAEEYHQDYFAKKPNDPYCNAVLVPKLDKLKKVFADKLKSDKKLD
jgi:peptide-methionine (S)-S-oxide reductase